MQEKIYSKGTFSYATRTEHFYYLRYFEIDRILTRVINATALSMFMYKPHNNKVTTIDHVLTIIAYLWWQHTRYLYNGVRDHTNGTTITRLL